MLSWRKISLISLLWLGIVALQAAQCTTVSSCAKTSDCTPCGAGYLCETGFGGAGCYADTLNTINGCTGTQGGGNIACETTADCQNCNAANTPVYYCIPYSSGAYCDTATNGCSQGVFPCQHTTDCAPCTAVGDPNLLCINSNGTNSCSNTTPLATACATTVMACTDNTDCQVCGSGYICANQLCTSAATACANNNLACQASSECQVCGANSLC